MIDDWFVVVQIEALVRAVCVTIVILSCPCVECVAAGAMVDFVGERWSSHSCAVGVQGQCSVSHTLKEAPVWWKCAESVQGANATQESGGTARYSWTQKLEGAEHSTVSYEDAVWTTEPVAWMVNESTLP